MMICLISTSCTVGVKKDVRIVYVSFARTPEVTKGAIKIATNRKIPVTVEGEETTLDLGGWNVVSNSDLKGFIEAINELQKRK